MSPPVWTSRRLRPTRPRIMRSLVRQRNCGHSNIRLSAFLPWRTRKSPPRRSCFRWRFESKPQDSRTPPSVRTLPTSWRIIRPFLPFRFECPIFPRWSCLSGLEGFACLPQILPPPFLPLGLQRSPVWLLWLSLFRQSTHIPRPKILLHRARLPERKPPWLFRWGKCIRMSRLL